jgi:hypothetical protein
LLASTNLVLELGIILYLLMGWQFMAGEWIGGPVLVAIMSPLVKLTYPKKLVESARKRHEDGEGHQHMSMTVEGSTWRERLLNPETRIRVAQNFTMECAMLWKDLLAGFLVGGLLSSFVPEAFWKTLFLTDASPWIRVPVDALIGPVVAMLTFVCSIGNVPLAAVLWAGGASFGGILAFLYGDLIILPLLDVYRRYFGWRMAAYMAVVFFATMALSACIMDVAFAVAKLTPVQSGHVSQEMTQFSLNYTFWLNLVFGLVGIYWFWLSRRDRLQRAYRHSAGHRQS